MIFLFHAVQKSFGRSKGYLPYPKICICHSKKMYINYLDFKGKQIFTPHSKISHDSLIIASPNIPIV